MACTDVNVVHMHVSTMQILSTVTNCLHLYLTFVCLYYSPQLSPLPQENMTKLLNTVHNDSWEVKATFRLTVLPSYLEHSSCLH